MWHSITDCCQNACYHVILVRDLANNRILSYCRDCGAAWSTPKDYDENNFVIGAEHFALGFAQPTDAEVRNSLWSDRVKFRVLEEDFSSVEQLNAGLTNRCTRPPQRLA